MSYLQLAQQIRARLRDRNKQKDKEDSLSSSLHSLVEGWEGEKSELREQGVAAPPSLCTGSSDGGSPPSALRPGTPGFSEAVARLLGLRLDTFASADEVLEIMVPWLNVPLFFTPTEAAAEGLIRQGLARRGQVWTGAELMNLLSVSGITHPQARSVALAKLKFEGDVTEVRPADRWGRDPAGDAKSRDPKVSQDSSSDNPAVRDGNASG